MNTLKRKLTAILLTFAMLFSLMPALPQAAEAADQTTVNNDLIQVDYVANGAVESNVNVYVKNEQGELLTQEPLILENIVAGTPFNVTVTLLDDKYIVKNLHEGSGDATLVKFDNEKVSFNWAYMDSETSLTVTVAEKIDRDSLKVDNWIEGGGYTRGYYIYQDQLLKMIALQDSNLQDNIQNLDIRGIKIQPNWIQPFYAGTDSTGSNKEFRQVDTLATQDRAYWDLLKVTSDNGNVEKVQPDRLQSLTITYNYGQGEKTIVVPSSSLHFYGDSSDYSYTIGVESPDRSIVVFYDRPGATQDRDYRIYDIRLVTTGEALGLENMPENPEYEAGTLYEFVNWEYDDWSGNGLPFLSTTPVKSDVNVFSHKVSSAEYGGTEIRVMNTEDQLLNRIVELYNADGNHTPISKEQIDLQTVRIRAYDSNANESTDDDYSFNGWKNNHEYYSVKNYRATGNTHISFNGLDGIRVYFELNGQDSKNDVYLPVGENVGDIAKLMIGPENEHVLKLYVLQPGDVIDTLEEPEEEPDAPTDDDIKALLDDALTVECVTAGVNHEKATYDVTAYDRGDITNKDGVFTLEISVEKNTDSYIKQYDETTNKTHALSGEEQDYTITLVYNDTDKAWTVDKDDATAAIKVECKYDLTGITKTLVTTDLVDDATEAGVTDVKDNYTIPANADDTVTIPYGEDGKVTLLYQITVNGVAGATFSVTDDGATLAPSQSGVTQNAETGAFEGTIPADASSVTFYVAKAFTADNLDEDGYLTNSVTLKGGDGSTVDPKEDEDEEKTPGVVDTKTFKLTYDVNGGSFTGSDSQQAYIDGLTADKEYSIWHHDENGKEVGTIPTEPMVAWPYHADENGTAVALIGWSDTRAEKIVAAGEQYPDLVDAVTFTDNDKTVYAVWGYDENGDDIADATQVMVIPADITIYTGGTGYSGVTDANGDLITSTETTTGLPEPGYHFILPASAGGLSGVDLSDKLTFSYDNGQEGDGSVTREWKISYVGIYATDENNQPTQYVYSIEAGTTESGSTIPVRLTYFNDLDGNGKYDANEVVQTDDITMGETLVSDQYSMTINSGGLNQGSIIATLGGTKYSVGAGTGTLTVKSTVTKEDNTSEIVNSTDEVNPDDITAVHAGAEYYVNDSEVTIGQERVQLLVDEVSNSADFNAAIENDAVNKSSIENDNAAAESAYLDLVDKTNGNTVITMGENDTMTILWPAPEDAASDSQYEIIHYTGMDRLDTVATGDLVDMKPEKISGNLVTVDGKNYIQFETTSFSPFVLVYETDDGSEEDPGTDNPPYNPDPWVPTPDDGDGPDGLNTEDHFYYVVGYEDGMVKPQNNITRAEVATIFYRLLESDVRAEYDTTVNNFSDVDADDWFNQTVSTLSSMGIVKGYEDGTFRPNAPITRAEFAAIATRFFEETGATYESGTFSDVIGDEWFAGAIQDAVNLGLIGGYEDGTVRPNNNITRAEACAIVNRTLGRVPDADHLLPDDVMKTWPDNPESAWFYADMQEATNGHEYEWITEDGNKVENWTDLLDKDWNDR